MELTPEKDSIGIHIIPGNLCNLRCAHCVTDSSPEGNEALTENEIKELSETIRSSQPKSLLFSGGEPTLYIHQINRLISALPDKSTCRIHITTNGSFALRGASNISKILDSFTKIDHLQLSLDRFHTSALDNSHIQQLTSYCKEKQIGFNISISITDPSDLVEMRQTIQSSGAKAIFSKVESCGRAKTNNVGFRSPVFDRSVLHKQCPNLNIITYVHGRGFSACCSNLVFNTKKNTYLNNSLNEHLQSDFYNTLKSKTFGQMLADKNIDPNTLSPSHSSECSLCEYIHEGNPKTQLSDRT